MNAEVLLRDAVSLKPTKAERDEKRGYSIDMKRVVMAYGIEILVIAASLAGALYFARKYGGGDMEVMGVMMLAPIGYAVIEFCRVPLALGARTQKNWMIKTAAFVGLICAALVTVKSMSQLGYLMFQPRLEEVTKTKRALSDIMGQRDTILSKRSLAEQSLEQRKIALDRTDAQIAQTTKELGSLPPPSCARYSFNNGRQSGSGTRCTPDPRSKMLNDGLVRAQANRDGAIAAFDAARKEVDALDVRAINEKVVTAQTASKEAIFHSQLHTFTGMVFGKDPDKVTEDELHWFLRLFVFIPAICVSFASSLLAFTAVEKVKKRPDPALMADQAGQYLLGPMAQAFVEEASRVVEKTAQDVMREARTTSAASAAAAAHKAKPNNSDPIAAAKG